MFYCPYTTETTKKLAVLIVQQTFFAFIDFNNVFDFIDRLSS